jgi:glycine cleavage system H protein
VSPQELLFSKSHEWVHLSTGDDGSRIATVGISGFALEALTDLVHIELPKVGKQVKAGSTFGEVESVKAVSDLYSPVDGEIVAVHTDLTDKLETLGADPYGDGWMVKIKVTDERGLGELMDFSAYEQQCAAEGH